MKISEQEQHVALADSAQAAINKVANEVMAMSEMDLFKEWLKLRKDRALSAMGATTGDEFTGHAERFEMLTGALQAVFMYECEARG